MAWDWKMQVDIGNQLIFLPEIAATTLRPDLVLWSHSPKPAYITELTVPWEELAADAQQRGWKAKVCPVEVGCRGFVASSTIRLMKDLGIHGQALQKTVRSISEVASGYGSSGRTLAGLIEHQHDPLTNPPPNSLT